MSHSTSKIPALSLVAFVMFFSPSRGISDASIEASSDLLVGEWKLDFEKTWEVSEEAFLADTMRGADAYPDDPAEKSAIVKGEMEGVLKTVVVRYEASGTLNLAMGGAGRELKAEIVSSEGNSLELSCENGKAFRELEVEFKSADRIHITIVHALPPGSKATMVWVLNRAEE